MNCNIILSFVNHIDNKSVSLINLDGRSRELPVHCNNVVCIAQPLHWCFLNLIMENALIQV